MDTSRRTTSTSRTGRRGPPLRWAQKVARRGRLRGLLASTTRQSRRRRGQRLRAAGARVADASRRPVGAQRKGSAGGHPRPRRAACCPLAHRPGSHPRTWATPRGACAAGRSTPRRPRAAARRSRARRGPATTGGATAPTARPRAPRPWAGRAARPRRPSRRRRPPRPRRRTRRPAGAINRVVGGVGVRRGRRGTGRARRGAAREPKA